MTKSSDVTEMLGMRSRAALIVIACNCAGGVAATVATVAAGGSPLFGAMVVVLYTMSILLTARVPGDPMPLRSTIPVVLAGPLGCALMLWTLPRPDTSPLQFWPVGYSCVVFTFLCVRGRTGWAWVGYAGVAAVTVNWSVHTGQETVAGYLHIPPNAALMIMGTAFALAMRRPVLEIFRLREEATRQAAEEAAAAAALEERDEQLTKLDELARPLLTRIASGEPLSVDDRESCRLLESHLRDTLRAAGLDEQGISSATRSARGRGVEVTLLDDRGGDASEPVDRRILDSVTSTLESTAAGAVTVRLLPRDRDIAASILVTDDGGTRLLELGRDATRLIVESDPC